MKWIALFSHTGTEIVNISNKIGQWPDKIITNKPPGSEDIHEGIRDVCYTSSKPSALNYSQLLDSDSIITMHGWMRIIPPEICKEFNILNLHPGLISKYPELKGKDPQKRVFENDALPGGGVREYDRVGCVIHKCSPEVDGGCRVMERSTWNCFSGEATLTDALHKMAEDLWVDFFNLYTTGKLDEVL
jgi:folate-dependent phosphoribosylglycinamide formyltransferase PurN